MISNGAKNRFKVSLLSILLEFLRVGHVLSQRLTVKTPRKESVEQNQCRKIYSSVGMRNNK